MSSSQWIEMSSFKDTFTTRVVGILLTIIASHICLPIADAQVGVNFGNLGDNLPPAQDVIALCKSNGITKIRIFEPIPAVLQALNDNPGISVVVGVKNLDIPGIAKDPQVARSWVKDNVLKYSKVNFRYISVGNEVDPTDPSAVEIAQNIGPAMQNIYNVISEAGLSGKVKVSTVLSAVVLGSSYPPSAGAFKPTISSFITPILQFLSRTQGPLLVNVYPYFAYASNPTKIKLDYAIFTSPSAVVIDGQYKYQNLFSAMVDAFHAAVEKAGASGVSLVVTETGWPTAGGVDTTIDNAKTYNSNLISYVKNGTPRKAGTPLETFIFDLFDENQKSPELEKHWGLFLPDKTPKYPLRFT